MSNATVSQGVVNRLASQAEAMGRAQLKYRNPRRVYLLALALLGLGAALPLATLVLQPSPLSAQTIPTNPVGGCPVPAATFNNWFQSGTPSVNGVVNPANSLTFSPPASAPSISGRNRCICGCSLLRQPLTAAERTSSILRLSLTFHL